MAKLILTRGKNRSRFFFLRYLMKCDANEYFTEGNKRFDQQNVSKLRALNHWTDAMLLLLGVICQQGKGCFGLRSPLSMFSF